MAPISKLIGGPSLRLLVVLAALLSHFAAAETLLEASSGKRVALAGNRKLLQSVGSSGGSTTFGDPPAGTLVVTWNPIPSKALADGTFGEVTEPPYQYDWFNTDSSSSCVNCSATLYFYPVDAYVAGSNGQKTQLIAGNQTITSFGSDGESTFEVGGCDINKRLYSDSNELFGDRTCLGAFNVPDNQTVDITQVWDLMQAPDGLEFTIPTPLEQIYCLAFFSGPSGIHETLTNFQASFDTGPIPVEPPTQNTLVTGIFSNIAFYSQPFTDPGTLTFKSINMRVQYDPPLSLDSFDWNFLYSHCSFSSNQLTVQQAPSKTLVPPSTACPPVNGFYTNSCFNQDGTLHVCCINPDSCGPFTDDGNPTCTNNQYYVFP